jgi:16S rRNA processing protein RimM
MALIRIGHLGRAHGVRGEIALEGASLSARELLEMRDFTWRRGSEPIRTLTLESARDVHERVLVSFAEAADRDQAAGLARGELLAEAEALPDPGPEMVYTFQLVGLRVIEEDGRELGVIAEVLRTGAHPVWVVRGERELLVPASPPVVRRVDLEAGRVVVALPKGLEDL